MKKLKVALLSGGISSEREVSIKSGNQVYEALDKNKYDIFKYDPKTDINKLVEEAKTIDVALILLHGTYGEDGTIQGLLDLLGVPYQGAGVLGSSISMNKLVAKRLYEQAGLKIPAYRLCRPNQEINYDEIIEYLGFPIVVKPVEGGSSIGMSIVKSKDLLKIAIEQAFNYDDFVLLEEYIKGIEITGSVLGNNENVQALPIIEIVPDKFHDFFDYEAKYTPGATQEICPARISQSHTKKAQEYAVLAHKTLFCKVYSRTDMILKDDEIYILETNTIPGMTPNSLFPIAAKTAGMSFSELLDKLIELSIQS
ncbi:MAG: D-alanine--D-alanine ligase [Desulfobacterales bacterium]|nr:D-alanine--D-alanine ligase [Desulfobacterales bacterium]